METDMEKPPFEGYKERPEWREDRQEFVGSNLQPFGKEYEREMRRQEDADVENAFDEFEAAMDLASFDSLVKVSREFPKWE